MKLLRFIPALFLFVACNSTQEGGEMDNMPAPEIAFIKRFNTADSAYSMNDNVIKKQEALKYHKEAIIKFVTDTLSGNADKWLGVLNKIEASRYADGVFEVTILVPKNNYLDKEMPELNTIRLNAKVDSNTVVKNALKDMQKGDRVIITGTFVKDIVGNIDYNANDFREQDTFNEPEFNFKIENISKRK